MLGLLKKHLSQYVRMARVEQKKHVAQNKHIIIAIVVRIIVIIIIILQS